MSFSTPNTDSGLTSIIVKDAPAKLKRDLDAVLNLQAELDSINQHLVSVRKIIAEDAHNKEASYFLDSLWRTHERAISKVEELYASLNVTDAFPEVQGLPLEFMRTLLMARDLKMNIRKRAIGTFFEWERLDRAAGGRDEPLGKREDAVRCLLTNLFQGPNCINKHRSSSPSGLLR